MADNPSNTPAQTPATGIPGSTTDLGVPPVPQGKKVDRRPRDADSDYAPDELGAAGYHVDDAEEQLSNDEKYASRFNPNEPQLEFSPELVGANHDRVDLVTYMTNEFGLTSDNARDVMVNLKHIKIHDAPEDEGAKFEGDHRSIPVDDINGKIVSVISTNRSVRFKYSAQ